MATKPKGRQVPRIIPLEMHLLIALTAAFVAVTLSRAASGGRGAKTVASGSAMPAAGAQLERPLPAGALMRLGTTRLRHDEAVTGVAFTPDGKALVSCASYDKIRVWDVRTGNQSREFGDFWGSATAIAVSPDGKRLFAGGQGLGDKLRVWDLATGNLLMSAPGGRWGVDHLALSLDGQTLATVGEEGTVYLWKMEKGLEFIETPFRRPMTIGNEIGGLAFSPDGKLLAASSRLGKVWIWEVGSEKEPSTVSVPDASVESVAFSPDGKLFASAGGQSKGKGEGKQRTVGQVWIWDPARGRKLLESEAHPSEPVKGIAFSPDGRMLASVADLGRVSLWDPATGSQIRTLETGHDWRASHGAIAFSPDGKLLATGGQGVAVRLWEVATGEPVLADAEAHWDSVKCVGVSSDGTLIVSSGWRTIRVWDAATGKQLHALRCERGGFNDAALSADGKLVASAGSDGSVRLWDPASGEQVQSFPGDWQSPPSRVAFSPDGSLLAAVYVSYHPFPTPPSSTLRVWQVGTGQELLSLGPIEGQGERMAFSTNNKVLACVSPAGRMVYSWDIPRGTERPVFELVGNAPRNVVGLSPDAGILVDMDPEIGEVNLLNPLTGRAIRSIAVSGEYLSLVAFSADNALLAASARSIFRRGAFRSERERTLRVFETATGRELIRFDTDDGSVLSLAFSPDGKQLVTGMGNTTVLVWDLSSAR